MTVWASARVSSNASARMAAVSAFCLAAAASACLALAACAVDDAVLFEAADGRRLVVHCAIMPCTLSVVSDGPALTHFVAERGGRAVGHAMLYRRPAGNLREPEESIDLVELVTLPEVRGSGVGRALTEHVLSYAHLNSYTSVLTEWSSVNLAASRFWPRRGFRTQYLRLYRAVP